MILSKPTYVTILFFLMKNIYLFKKYLFFFFIVQTKIRYIYRYTYPQIYKIKTSSNAYKCNNFRMLIETSVAKCRETKTKCKSLTHSQIGFFGLPPYVGFSRQTNLLLGFMSQSHSSLLFVFLERC